jgi:cephalosporin hydroxylase
MWNYQEIIWEVKPSLLVEFGTCKGGSAKFFAAVMCSLPHPFRILSVDINDCGLTVPYVEFMVMSSTDERVKRRISQLRSEFPGPMFAILDSDHSCDHVFSELSSLRDLTRQGDYVVVEDSNINGHPVYPSFGPGPYEAMRQYFERFPHDYQHDKKREQKFGFTFATNGFLRRLDPST